MLHYAEVSGLDLTGISSNKLKVEINGKSFTITWHPEHSKALGRKR